jgi:hypothetical protein
MWMQWILNVLIGLLVAFGGVILRQARDDIREIMGDAVRLENKIEGQRDRLDKVIVPNVGVGMCNKIQEDHNAKMKYFYDKCDDLDTRSRENREALIRFDGKLDLILHEVRGNGKET